MFFFLSINTNLKKGKNSQNIISFLIKIYSFPWGMEVPSVYDMDNILVSLMLTNCTKFKLHLNFLENYSHLENNFSIHFFGRGGDSFNAACSSNAAILH